MQADFPKELEEVGTVMASLNFRKAMQQRCLYALTFLKLLEEVWY